MPTESSPAATVVAAKDDSRLPKGSTVLRVENLVKHYRGRSRLGLRAAPPVQAVSDVSFHIDAGETLGLVGESGCGKTTTARCIVHLTEPTSGRIWFKGTDLAQLDRRALKKVRQDVQYVFQDPSTAFNPRMTVRDVIAEPLRIHRLHTGAESDRVAELLDMVGLRPELAGRYPHEFSGGQRQRIGIARALATDPQLLILDEPVSALDASVQAQVINLLADLQDRLDLAYLFVAHDLSVIRHISDRVTVMYLGQIVETGSRSDIFERPTHPYTQALLSAVPVSDPDLRASRERLVLHGEIPSPSEPPSGCRFRTRCWKAEDRCVTDPPPLAMYEKGHLSACHFAEERKIFG